MKKKLLCILFVLCMALNMLPATAMASSQYYIDENGDSQSLSEFTLVNSSTTEWTDGWYLVYGAVTISGGVTVNGNVCLVLMDSCHLMVTTPTVSSSDGTPRAGINVPAGSSLTIYGQTGGSGRLSATGSEVKDVSGGGGAGIGGNGSFSDQAAGENCGAVTICGGVITATGKSGGAGIGGGAGYHSVGVNTNTTKGGNGGVVKIFGGDVTATGNNGGAGIGGGAGGFSDGYSSIKGAEGGSGGEVSIYGGIVKATGKYGAGIGGGQGGNSYVGGGKGGNGGTVTISGGTVTAKGEYGGSGIGGGSGGNGGSAPSQTGGDGGNGSVVTITGGTVTATGARGAGIGGGRGGNTNNASDTGQALGGNGGNGLDVTIEGGTVVATSSRAAGIGGGGYGKRDSVSSLSYDYYGKGGKQTGTVTITGGTVNAKGEDRSAKIGDSATQTDTYAYTYGATVNPKDKTGNKLYLTTVTLKNAGAGAANKEIAAVQGYSSYSIKDTKTDANGKLYLYLPLNSEIKSVITGDDTRYGGYVVTNSSDTAAGDFYSSLTIENINFIGSTDTGGDRIILTFNEEVKTDSAGTVTIKWDGVDPIPLDNPQWSEANTALALITPELEADIEYTVTVSGFANILDESMSEQEKNFKVIRINAAETSGGYVSFEVDNTAVNKSIKGQVVTIKSTPNTGYSLNQSPKVRKTDNSSTTVSVYKTGDGIYTFTMPDYEVTVAGSYSKVNYSFYKAGISNGSLTIKRGDSVLYSSANYEDLITLIASPSTGYILDTIKVTKYSDSTIVPLNKVEGEDNTYTFTMPNDSVRFEVTFAKVLSITVPASEGGTVSTEADMPIIKGKTVKFAAAPQTGYAIDEIKVYRTGTEYTKVTYSKADGEENTYTFTMPDYDVTVQVTFGQVYQLTVEGGGTGATAGGDFIADKTVSISAGTKDGFTFKNWTSPDGVVFDDAESPATTFAMPTRNVTVTANWEPVSSGGGSGGYTPPSPAGEVKSGETISNSSLEQLISSGKNLTVTGDNGAKLVLGTEVLGCIAGQASGPVKAEINDVSYEYQMSHPDKKVFYMAVSSGGRTISDLGGNVTVTVPYELKDGEKAEDLTVWRLTNSGIMNELPCTYDPASKLLTFEAAHSGQYIAGADSWSNPFTDVGENDWFYRDVKFANRNRLFVGTGFTTFSPASPMARAMLWTVLGRLDGGEKLYGEGVYESAREWAMNAGITDGTNPDGEITREQVVTILWRYAGKPKAGGDLSRFSDAESVSDYAREAMAWAVEKGIILGNDGALLPQGSASRAQVAAILQRYVEATMK